MTVVMFVYCGVEFCFGREIWTQSTFPCDLTIIGKMTKKDR